MNRYEAAEKLRRRTNASCLEAQDALKSVPWRIEHHFLCPGPLLSNPLNGPGLNPKND